METQIVGSRGAHRPLRGTRGNILYIFFSVGGNLKLKGVDKVNFLGPEDLETNFSYSLWLG